MQAGKMALNVMGDVATIIVPDFDFISVSDFDFYVHYKIYFIFQSIMVQRPEQLLVKSRDC